MTTIDEEAEIFSSTHPKRKVVDASTFPVASEALITAIKKKNKQEAEKHLLTDSDVNKRDNDGLSLLHLAIKTNDFDIVDYVINKGAEVNVVAKDETALMLAASKKNEQIIRYLIENGAHQEYSTEKGKVTLDFGNENVRKLLLNYTGEDLKSKKKIFEAAKENNTDEVIYLLMKGSSINEKDKDGTTPYLYACKTGNLKLVSILTNLGCNEEVTDKDGNNAPFLATLNKQNKILKFLYLRGIDFKFAIRGETMLHLAIVNNDYDMVRYLLDIKCDPTIRNKDGLDSLFYAISLDRDKIIPLLFNPEAKTELYNEMNPIMFACEKNRLNTVNKLIELKSDLHFKNASNYDAFMIAVKNGFIDIASSILNAGVDVNEIGPSGDSCLMTAIRYSNIQTAKFCIEKGCRLNHINNMNENCFIYCVHYQKLDILTFLLEKVDDDEKYYLCRKSLYSAISANDFKATEQLLAFFKPREKDPFDCLVKYAKTEEMRAKLIKADQADINLKVKKDRTIFNSCQENFIQEIKYFIVKSEQNLELRNPSGWTPLIMAASCGKIDAVKFLVSIGADRKAKTNSGTTAISIATQNGHTQVIDYLMSVGESPSEFATGGNTCLCTAALCGKLDVCKFLVEEKSIDINEKNQFGKKPIFYATEKGHVDIVKFFISKGADVNEVGYDGVPLLFLAYQKGQMEVHKILIENGAETNCNDKNGLNLLHYSATKNDKQTAQICIDNGANINEAREIDHLTPYLIACYSGSLEFLQFLEEKGAVIDLESCNGVGPVYAASESGHLHVVKYLVETKNLPTNHKDIHGMTPLLVACKFGHPEVVSYLIEKGSSYDEADKENCNALYYACQNGNLELVKMLIKKFDVNAKCWNGNTCLHVACMNGNLDVVKFLLKRKADIHAKTLSDSMPIHLAAQYNHSSIIKVLLSYDKEMIDARGHNYNTPLTIAALNESFDAVKFLLSNGAKINARNATRLSVMHLTAAEGRIYLMRELLKIGFDINERLDNETPLGRAAMHCQWDMVKFLVENGAKKENNKALSALHRCVKEDRMNHFMKLLDLGFKIDEKGVNGQIPLVTAILNERMNFIDYFIEKKVDINSRDEEDKIPLYHAISVNSKDILLKLIQNKANVNYQRLRDTPVMHAIETEKVEMLKLLLQNKADANLPSKIGKYPAHFSVIKDDNIYLETIAEFNADFNVQDREFQYTPLIQSIVLKKPEHIKWLIERKVNVTLKDKKGKSAFYYSIQDLETAEKIRQLGGDVNEVDGEGCPLICYCLKNKYNECVMYLIDKGVDLNTKTQKGDTILVKTLKKDAHKDIAIKLIEKGADLSIPGKDGNYPAHIVVKKNYLDIMQMFIDRKVDLNVANKQGKNPLTLTNWETATDKQMARLLKKNGAKDLCFEKICEDMKLQFEHQQTINEKTKEHLANTKIEIEEEQQRVKQNKEALMDQITKIENDLKENQDKKTAQPPLPPEEVAKVDAAIKTIEADLKKKGAEMQTILAREEDNKRKSDVYTADMNKLEADVAQLQKDRETLEGRIAAYNALDK